MNRRENREVSRLDAEHWRSRAAKMRTLSETVKDIGTKDSMLQLAEDYDKLAARAFDRAARDQDTSPSPTPKK
jgi:hypothetical protein